MLDKKIMKQELWSILTHTTDWVKYSDNKAVLLLTLHGVILTIIYTNANNVYEFYSKNCFTIFLSTLIALANMGSIICSFLVINPRLDNNNPTSIIYFGHIQEKFEHYTDYYKSVEVILTEKKKLEEQLAEQIHTNSLIAWKKFTYVTFSLRWFFISIIFFLISIVYYLISK